MKALSIELVENELPHFRLASLHIEKQISAYSLEFPNAKDVRVEWKMKLPMFVPAFYDLIQHHAEVPVQPQFWSHYQSRNTDWFLRNQLSEELLAAVKARAFRAYPSLVRDLHFAKVLAERNLEIEVFYNQRLDLEAGIDLLIKSNGNLFAINLFTDTKRAKEGRAKKEFRHGQYSNVTYLEIPVAFKGSKKVGDFFLYGDRELKLVVSELEKSR